MIYKTVELEDGCEFTGLFAGDKRLYGTKTYPNGATYTGFYVDDVREGVGIKQWADGTQVTVHYVKGIKRS